MSSNYCLYVLKSLEMAYKCLFIEERGYSSSFQGEVCHKFNMSHHAADAESPASRLRK